MIGSSAWQALGSERGERLENKLQERWSRTGLMLSGEVLTAYSTQLAA